MYISAAELLLAAPGTDDLMRPLIQCADGITSIDEMTDEDLEVSLRLQNRAFEIVSQSADPLRNVHLMGIYDRMATSFAELGNVPAAVQCFANIETMKARGDIPPDTPKKLIVDTSFYQRALAGDNVHDLGLHGQANASWVQGRMAESRYFGARAAVVDYMTTPSGPVEPA